MAFRDLAADPWGDRLLDIFKSIRAEAQRAAEEASRLRDERLTDAIEPAVEQVKDLADQIEEIQAAAPLEAPAAKAKRPGTFGEADLATLALDRATAGVAGFKGATEDSQKRLEKILSEIKARLDNPAPTVIAWS